MEFKVTEGKWYIENLNEPKKGKYPAFEIDISTERAEAMCTVWYCEDLPDELKDEIKANALLISKAPEMLEELKIAVKALKAVHSLGASTPIIKRWEKLIKEATEI
jgi:hypothetical protein